MLASRNGSPSLGSGHDGAVLSGQRAALCSGGEQLHRHQQQHRIAHLSYVLTSIPLFAAPVCLALGDLHFLLFSTRRISPSPALCPLLPFSLSCNWLCIQCSLFCYQRHTYSRLLWSTEKHFTGLTQFKLCLGHFIRLNNAYSLSAFPSLRSITLRQNAI